MRTFQVTDMGSDKSLSLVSTLSQQHESPATKRVAELEGRVARLKAELQEAEAALEFEKARMPLPGDFVRCPLTRFFGRVTKVTPRPTGRPWIEIVPYLGPNLPGHSSMDLFDSWELIDPPSDIAEATADESPRFPTIAPFMSVASGAPVGEAPDKEMEESIRLLLAPSSPLKS